MLMVRPVKWLGSPAKAARGKRGAHSCAARCQLRMGQPEHPRFGYPFRDWAPPPLARPFRNGNLTGHASGGRDRRAHLSATGGGNDPWIGSPFLEGAGAILCGRSADRTLRLIRRRLVLLAPPRSKFAAAR